MDFPFYTPKDAFPVGGAVRDLLLGRRPTDLDYAALDPEKAAEEARQRLPEAIAARMAAVMPAPTLCD